MSNKTCNEIPQEKLVAFADGDLPPDEVEHISKHIARCLSCRLMVEALQRSLELTQQSWQQEYSKGPQWQVPDKPGFKIKPIFKVLAIAAGILIVAGVGLLMYSKRDNSRLGSDEDVLIAQTRQAINRAGLAAQLLAVADLLAQQPGGMEYAKENYNELVKDYADTEQAKQAEIKLKEYSEGSLKL
jgi:hypothetical protein